MSVDHAAILKRVQQMIDLLRTRHVCDGWKLDEERAERTLQYFRSRAAGSPDDDEEWGRVVEFVHHHGQSLDWIIAGDPGRMICRGAGQSAQAKGGLPRQAVTS